jgi:hypothetical protein
LRDYIATSAATVVFIIGLFTLTQKRTELKSTLRKQLTDYIAKIQDLNVEQGKSRVANKKDDYPPDFIVFATGGDPVALGLVGPPRQPGPPPQP